MSLTKNHKFPKGFDGNEITPIDKYPSLKLKYYCVMLNGEKVFESQTLYDAKVFLNKLKINPYKDDVYIRKVRK